MKKDKKITAKFERLTESSEGLVGGFSSSIKAQNVSLAWGTNERCSTTNNCNGGNCVKGCGSSI